MIAMSLTVILCLLVLPVRSFSTFVLSKQCRAQQSSTILHWASEKPSSSEHNTDAENLFWIGQPETTTETKSIAKALENRQEELKRGIGKRYVVRTQQGFLNVHSDISKGPYATDNIIKHLYDGDIVISQNRIGDWIKHDKGGWSIARHDGFLWLQEVRE